jgi:hypothetical protein
MNEIEEMKLVCPCCDTDDFRKCECTLEDIELAHLIEEYPIDFEIMMED